MKRERDSGIELLKIIAIFMIVISHVVQTLGSIPKEISNYPIGAFIDLQKSTTNVEAIILQNLRYLGSLGNAIFFICSAWFLCDSKKTSLNKIIRMLLDIWVISVLYIVIAGVAGIDISGKIIIKSFFPTTFSNNWYITFYVLFYAIHPLLNMVIEQLNQKSLLQICLISFALYFGLCFVKGDLFFSSQLITYTVLYFCIAYIKKYAHKYTVNMGLNVKILVVMVLANMGIIILTDLLGLVGARYVEKLGAMVLRWGTNCNPFLVVTALSLFNIFRERHFVNRMINYVASLSLLIYAIHENIVFRTYIRTQIFINIYEKYGYDNLLIWVGVFIVALFLLSIMAAVIYQKSIQKITLTIADKVSPKLVSISDRLQEKIIRIE